MTARDMWRWTDERGVQRLVSADELRAALLDGSLRSSTLVWRDGMKEWVPAATVAELQVTPDAGKAPGAAPAPVEPAATEAKPQKAAVRRPTLRGLPLSAVVDEPAAKVPLEVPAVGGRASITQVPPYGAPPTDNDPRVVEIPGAPPAPRSLELPPNVPPVRAVAPTADIDMLWAAPGSGDEVPVHRRVSGAGSALGKNTTTPSPTPAAVASTKPNALPEAAAVARPKDRPPLVASVKTFPGLAKPAEKALDARPDRSRAGQGESSQGVGPRGGRERGPDQGPKPGAHESEARVARKPHPRPPLRSTTLTGVTDAEVAGRETAPIKLPTTPTPALEPELTPLPPVASPEAATAALARPLSVPPPAAPADATPLPERQPLPSHPSYPPLAASPSHPPPAAPTSSRPPATPSTSSLRPSRPADPRRRGVSAPMSVPLSSLLASGGALIGMAIASFFAGRLSAASSADRPLARASLGLLPALARAATSSSAKAKPCWMVKQPAMWAREVSKSIPFEIAPTGRGGVAVGYARTAKQAAGIQVNLATGDVADRFDENGGEDIERVFPTLGGEFRVTRTRDGAELKFPIEVPAVTPFAVGVFAGSIAVASPPASVPASLWPLEGDEGLSAASLQATGVAGYALVFRRSGAIWSGLLGADRKATFGLAKVGGSGGAVGKPAVSSNGKELVVIFADRPNADGPYQIRLGHAPIGASPSTTTVFPLPKGGPGGDAFAPSIAGLPDGRWLLIWTEGPPGSRAVRAQTLTPNLAPLGDPIALSPPAGNYGQGIVGVVDGYAATVFLSKGSSSYELWGAVLQCE